MNILKENLYVKAWSILFSSWELENDPAERTVPSVDPANLNQVILAEGNNSESKQPRLYKNSKFQTSFKNPRVLAEIAIFTSLATVLSTIVIYVMPQGGSITLASMVPIWLAMRRGPKLA